MHLAAEAQRRFVDVVSQVLINWVITERLVDKELILNAALHVFHLDLQTVNLFILGLTTA